MSDALDQLESTLKTHNLSLTLPRKVVFSALQDQEALSMHQLIELCAEIDRASVYRTVSIFEQLGIIQRIQVGWKYRLELGDNFRHHHHHLQCVGCNQTFPLPEDDLLEDRLSTLAIASGFTAQDHQIEIRGICRKCQMRPT